MKKNKKILAMSLAMLGVCAGMLTYANNSQTVNAAGETTIEWAAGDTLTKMTKVSDLNENDNYVLGVEDYKSLAGAYHTAKSKFYFQLVKNDSLAPDAVGGPKLVDGALIIKLVKVENSQNWKLQSIADDNYLYAKTEKDNYLRKGAATKDGEFSEWNIIEKENDLTIINTQAKKSDKAKLIAASNNDRVSTYDTDGGQWNHHVSLYKISKPLTPEGEAKAFSKKLIETTNSDCAAKEIKAETWAAVKTAWTALSTDAQKLFKEATAKEDGTDLEKGAARYDACLTGHPTLENFAGRTTTTAGSNAVSFNNDSTIIIVSVSVLTVALLGAAVLLMKRRKVSE